MSARYETQKLANACLTGLHSKDPDIRAAAESVMSYLMHRLNDKTIGLPDELINFANMLGDSK